MKKTVRVAIVLVAVLALLVVLLPGQALASHITCNNNEFCDWKHIAFNIGNPNNLCWHTDANRIDNYVNFSWYKCWSEGAGNADNLNDDTSSAKNTFDTQTIRLCRGKNGGTPCTTFPPDTEAANLSDFTVGNDQASSHRP